MHVPRSTAEWLYAHTRVGLKYGHQRIASVWVHNVQCYFFIILRTCGGGHKNRLGGHGTPVLPFDDMPVKKRRFNTELRQHFFTDRIINLWNSLDEQIVSSTSLNCFKNGLELMGHVQSCFGYSSPEAEPVPPSGEASTWWVSS